MGALLLASLAGCTPTVYRIASLDYPPSSSTFTCIGNVLSRMDGVSNVTYEGEQITTLKPLFSGKTLTGRFHSFRYIYQGVRGSLFTYQDGLGNTTLNQQVLGDQANFDIFQRETDILLPKMEEIEKTLEQQCYLKGIARSAKKHCTAIKC